MLKIIGTILVVYIIVGFVINLMTGRKLKSRANHSANFLQ
jgi:uncharacterized membrane-anchored protein YhcB (DUF1043 family)